MKTNQTEDRILSLLSQQARTVKDGQTATQLARRIARTKGTTNTSLTMLKAKGLIAFTKNGWVITTSGKRHMGDF